MREEQRKGQSPSWFVPLWVSVGSVAVIAGGLCRTDISCHWHTFFGGWVWSDSMPRSLGRNVPILLGVVSLAIVLLRKQLAPGALLTLSPAAALVSYSAASFYSSCPWAIQTLVQMIVGASLVASGNHVTRNLPDRKLPRILAAIGGCMLLVPYLIKEPEFARRTILYRVWGELLQVHGRYWEAALFAMLLLAYGLLGLLSPLTRLHSKARTRAVSWLGYFLLVSFPYVLLHVSWHSWGEYSPLHIEQETTLYRLWRLSMDERVLMIKFWLLGTGHTMLLSAGVVVWMEENLIEKPRT